MRTEKRTSICNYK